MLVFMLLDPAAAKIRARSFILISFCPATLIARRNATYLVMCFSPNLRVRRKYFQIVRESSIAWILAASSSRPNKNRELALVPRKLDDARALYDNSNSKGSGIVVAPDQCRFAGRTSQST